MDEPTAFFVRTDWEIAANEILYIKPASDLAECKCFCGNDPNCKSFYYHDQTKKCELRTGFKYTSPLNRAQPGYDTGFKIGKRPIHNAPLLLKIICPK